MLIPGRPSFDHGHTIVRDNVQQVSDSVSVFAAHASGYEAERRRLVPCFEDFYGTAVRLLSLRGGEVDMSLTWAPAPA